MRDVRLLSAVPADSVVNDNTDFFKNRFASFFSCAEKTPFINHLTDSKTPGEGDTVVLVDLRLFTREDLESLLPHTDAALLIADEALTPLALELAQGGVRDLLGAASCAQEIRFRLSKLVERLQERDKISQNDGELKNLDRRLKMIVEATRSPSTAADLNGLGALLLKKFATNMAAEGGSLFLVKENALKRLASLDPGHVPDLIPLPLRVDSPLFRVLNEKKSVLIEDVQQSLLIRSGWTGYQGQCGLLLPLVSGSGEVLGIITLHDKAGDPFTEYDRSIGIILAALSSELVQAIFALESSQKNEERYKLIFNEDITGDFVLDPQGEIGLYNPSFAHIFEIPQGRQGYHIQDFLIPDDRWPILKQEILIHRSLMLYDYQMKTASGRLVSVTGNFIAHYDAKGRFEFIQGFLLDITKRKRIESQSSHSQKMEALGRMASSVAHDFNNLMTAILGYGELIYETSQDLAIRSDVEEIIKAGERGAAMTKQLLSLGKNDLPPPRSLIHPDEMIRDMSGLFRQLVKGPVSLELDLHAPSALLFINPTEFEQILLNLVLNARDSMASGGVIRVRTSLMAPHSPDVLLRPELRPMHYFQMKVCDTGEGIAQEILPRIFEPFFSTKSAGKGSGIGLATVYKAIEGAQGLVEVESTQGIGADFIVMFPLYDSQGVLCGV